jgi:hypothetical protein
MTHGIREFLNIDGVEEETSLPIEEEEEEIFTISQEDPRLGTIDHAETMDSHEKELLKYARDLMELSFNVDPKSTASIAAVAANLFKQATGAKTVKRDAQLKAAQLALNARKVEIDERSSGMETAKTTILQGEVVRAKRNDILKSLKSGE